MTWQDALLVYIALGYTVMIAGYLIWIGTMIEERREKKRKSGK